MTKNNKNLSELLEFSLHKFDEQYQFYESISEQFHSCSELIKRQEWYKELLVMTHKGVGSLVEAHNESSSYYIGRFNEIVGQVNAIKESQETLKVQISKQNEERDEPEIAEESGNYDKYKILKVGIVIFLVFLHLYTHYELGIERQNNLIRESLFPVEMDSVNTILQNDVLRKEMLDSLDGSR